MIDKDIALEALGAICNAKVTSVQKQAGSGSGLHAAFQHLSVSSATRALSQLSVTQLINTAVDGDETCPVSRSNFARIQGQCDPQHCLKWSLDEKDGKLFILDEDEFFDPTFDYDFSGLKDTETYYRGGEVYERPCGWQRFALKVLDKYDGNTWLGTQDRSTQSVPGEWPVSYHATSKKGSEGIVKGFYKPGPRQRFGRGIYSTPYIKEALDYAKIFTSTKTGKSYQVILQNRINPEYREKHNNDKYWLVAIPAGKSDKEEKEMSERAIRPYGLLLKEV